LPNEPWNRGVDNRESAKGSGSKCPTTRCCGVEKSGSRIGHTNWTIDKFLILQPNGIILCSDIGKISINFEGKVERKILQIFIQKNIPNPPYELAIFRI